VKLQSPALKKKERALMSALQMCSSRETLIGKGADQSYHVSPKACDLLSSLKFHNSDDNKCHISDDNWTFSTLFSNPAQSYAAIACNDSGVSKATWRLCRQRHLPLYRLHGTTSHATHVGYDGKPDEYNPGLSIVKQAKKSKKLRRSWT